MIPSNHYPDMHKASLEFTGPAELRDFYAALQLLQRFDDQNPAPRAASVEGRTHSECGNCGKWIMSKFRAPEPEKCPCGCGAARWWYAHETRPSPLEVAAH